jgi:hypothetical protein
MAESPTINAAQLFSDDAGEYFIDAGVPRHNRRLSDKILAAFNHAYAMGEMDIARSLWECLVAAEKLGQEYHRRRPNQALDLAAEWVAFVDARDRYRDASRASHGDSGAASAAYRSMRDAHQNWTAQNGAPDAGSEGAEGAPGYEAGEPARGERP